MAPDSYHSFVYYEKLHFYKSIGNNIVGRALNLTVNVLNKEAFQKTPFATVRGLLEFDSIHHSDGTSTYMHGADPECLGDSYESLFFFKPGEPALVKWLRTLTLCKFSSPL